MNKFPAIAMLVSASMTCSAPHAHAAAVDYELTANTSPYSGANALVLGPTNGPTPAPGVVDYYWQHYLANPAIGGSEVGAYTGGNFASGDTLGFTTPEQFTQVSYLDGDAEVVHELITRYPELMQSGADPLYLLGYSQSSTILTAVDSHLNNQEWLDYVLTYGAGGQYAGDVQTLDGFGIGEDQGTLMGLADNLRLVLLGNPASDPGNGVAAGWDNSDITQQLLNSEAMGYGGGTILDGGVLGHINDAMLCTSDCVPGVLSDETDGYGMAGQNTNMDLSPTAVYTVQGDGWAQAIMGWFGPNQGSLEHTLYPGLDASDFNFTEHVGNVDYYTAELNFFQEMSAMFNAGWLAFWTIFQ